MPKYNYRSRDGSYGLTLENEQLQKMLSFAKAAIPNETGGILVGRYNSTLNVAILEDVSGPPVDSKAGKTWFHRGFKGLSRWLRQIWKAETHYLGEWHFHPFAQPEPSGVDHKQIKEISQMNCYQCKVPLLLILGGDPSQKWRVRVFVISTDRQLIECAEVK